MITHLTSIAYDPTVGAKIRSSFPKTPADVEMNNITAHALTMQYDIVITNANFDLVEIELTEANKHKSTVQIFTNDLQVCSCEQYHEVGVGYCKHIAVINAISKHPNTMDERLFAKTILRSKSKLNKFKSIKYIVYDSFKGCNVALGAGPIEKKAVSCAANERRLATLNSLGSITRVVLPSPYIIKDGVSLYDYQHDILENMLTAKRAVCSMTMGAGKTLTSIAGLKYLGTDGAKILIVCPKSIVKQWVNEIKRILGVNVFQITSKNISTFTDIYESGIGIATYQTMVRSVDKLATQDYSVVIADEIQYIKNEGSKTWGALKCIKSEYFWGLSGTVIENRLDDLYNIMQIIGPGLLGPKWKFDFKFKKLGSVHRKKVLYQNEIQNIAELRSLISSNIFSYDKISLPKISHHKYLVGMDPGARAAHDEFLEKANTLISKSLNMELSHFEKLLIQSYLLKARQACNSVELINKVVAPRGEKIKSILAVIKQICLEQGEKLVIFSEWTEMLSIIEREMLLDMSIGYVRFDGSMTAKARMRAIEQFKTDSLCMIFFSSDAGGIGIDGLQLVCNNMLHVELPWNPAKIDQRNGRLHRLMQTKDVNIHYMITSNSIEEKMSNLLDQKRKVRLDALF
jgi:superfamily II DNA or RNA helicase